MDPKYIEALQILVIGMGTVFTILFLVVQLTKLLVSVVNRLGLEEYTPTPISSSSIPRPHVAAILAGVEAATEGKARVKSITKIEKA
jgi:oxaloacetate decarboxylase gamma subunit